MTVNYPSIWELMSDLRDMGESNAILGRKAMVSRDVLLAADAIYKGKTNLERTLLTAELYGTPEGIPATFQMIFSVRFQCLSQQTTTYGQIGWKPGPNQPKPLERGSGRTNLKEVL